MIDLTLFDAVIFDMDGVLIDSEPLWKIAMEDTFREIGSHLTKKDFQQTVGLRLDEVIHYWNERSAWKNISPKEIENRIVRRMLHSVETTGRPLNGVIETLSFLKERGLKIGLGTSSYSVLIETVLKTLKINHFFDIAHSAENEDFGKPHPAVFLSVAQKLNVHPSKCLVIEDSLNGIIAAKAAKMMVVCIPEKTHATDLRLVLADHQFDEMGSLLQVFKRQKNG